MRMQEYVVLVYTIVMFMGSIGSYQEWISSE